MASQSSTTSAPPSPADAVRIGPVGAPERTIAPVVALWTNAWLTQPDGPAAASRWRFTREQLRFLAWWFAVDDTGRWLKRRGTLRRVKGWGKDPLAAALAVTEAIGPCRFGGFAEGGEDARDFGVDVAYRYSPGEPIAVANAAAWVQVAAVAREQTRTTFRLFPGLIPLRTRERFGADINKEIVYFEGGLRVIEAITRSPKSAEGPRTTFVIRNETQNWDASNDGHFLASTIDGNLTKSRDGAARALSICNAHVPGKDSVGEREWDAWQAIEQGRSRATDVLYDALEAPPDTKLDDEESLRRGLELARGDSTWLDIDRHVAEIYDPQTSVSDGRRKYLNQIIAAEDAWVAPVEWDVLGRKVAAREGVKAVDGPAPPLEDGEQIALGFDGSKTDDHSALIATRITNGDWVTLGVWDPEEHGGEAPREIIDGVVRHAFEHYDVVAFFADLEGWESYIDRWAEELGRQRGHELAVKASPKHAIAWDMRARGRELTLEGVMRLHDEIVERAFRHDANPRVRQHAHNARRRLNAWGVTFGKEHRESKRKVDSMAAGTLSRMARRAYLALPLSKQKARQRSGRRTAGRAVFV